MDSVLVKRCTKCGVPKPATVEFFHKSAKGKYGLNSQCKGCIAEAGRARYAANPEKRRAYQKEYVKCNPEKRRATVRKWKSENIERVRGKNREHNTIYRTRHRGRIRVASQKNARRRHEANPEIRRAAARRLREKNPEVFRRNSKRWRQKYPAKARAQARLYRARKVNAEGRHTADDIKSQFELQKGKCYWCKGELKEGYHVDHIYPLSKGGSNGPENICCACPKCNHRKNAKTPWEFAGRLF